MGKGNEKKKGKENNLKKKGKIKIKEKKEKEKGEKKDWEFQNPNSTSPPTHCKLLSYAVDYEVFKAGLETAIKQFAWHRTTFKLAMP